jgi:chemotaxis protein MotA
MILTRLRVFRGLAPCDAMTMNLSSLLGVLVGVAVVWFGIVGHSVRPEIFLDSHALILVLGGTLAAGLFAFPVSKFFELFDFFLTAVQNQEKRRYKLAKEIVEILGAMPGHTGATSKPRECSHPLLQEGYDLIAKRAVPEADYKRIMLQRNQRHRDKYLSDARALTALAKFPPAFGLLGATTGMISMLTGLSGNSQASIGPSMALALVATFWGIALANFAILPLADRATKLSSDDSQLRTMIITGCVLLYAGAARSTVIEHVASFLTPWERRRADWKALETRMLGDSRPPPPKHG